MSKRIYLTDEMRKYVAIFLIGKLINGVLPKNAIKESTEFLSQIEQQYGEYGNK